MAMLEKAIRFEEQKGEAITLGCVRMYCNAPIVGVHGGRMVRVRVHVDIAATCSLSAAFVCTVLLQSSVFVVETATACTADRTSARY
jgi:hypothetical protein